MTGNKECFSFSASLKPGGLIPKKISDYSLRQDQIATNKVPGQSLSPGLQILTFYMNIHLIKSDGQVSILFVVLQGNKFHSLSTSYSQEIIYN